jgi:hypothetical protein
MYFFLEFYDVPILGIFVGNWFHKYTFEYIRYPVIAYNCVVSLRETGISRLRKVTDQSLLNQL